MRRIASSCSPRRPILDLCMRWLFFYLKETRKRFWSEGVTGQGDAPEVPGRAGRAPLATNDKIEITKQKGAVFWVSTVYNKDYANMTNIMESVYLQREYLNEKNASYLR